MLKIEKDENMQKEAVFCRPILTVILNKVKPSCSTENTYFLRGSITVQLTSGLTGLDEVKQVNLLIVQSNKTAESKPVKQ